MSETTDRTAVTLDRRERRDRRERPDRRSTDRRAENRRTTEDRRSENRAIDAPDQRAGARRTRDERRRVLRRSSDRRQLERRTDSARDAALTEEEFLSFESALYPKTRLLSQILLALGLILLLKAL